LGRVGSQPKYGRLCADVVPKVIENDKECARLVEKMEALDLKKNPTLEEQTLSALLAETDPGL